MTRQYHQSEIDRLADVMTDYAAKVHGSSRRQDAQALAVVKQIQGGMFDTGDLVSDWAAFVLWNISGQYQPVYGLMREYLTPLRKPQSSGFGRVAAALGDDSADADSWEGV